MIRTPGNVLHSDSVAPNPVPRPISYPFPVPQQARSRQGEYCAAAINPKPSGSTIAFGPYLTLRYCSNNCSSQLASYYKGYSDSEKARLTRFIQYNVLPRTPKMCNVIERGEEKIVYRRYASLYFVAGVPPGTNELVVLEEVHLFVEVLDRYFGNVCEVQSQGFYFTKSSGTCLNPFTLLVDSSTLSSTFTVPTLSSMRSSWAATSVKPLR